MEPMICHTKCTLVKIQDKSINPYKARLKASKRRKSNEDRSFLILRDKAERILVKAGKQFKSLRKYLENKFIHGGRIHEGKWVQSKSKFPKE